MSSESMLNTIAANMRDYTAPVDTAFTGSRAAVLVPVTMAAAPAIILTLRATDLSSHAGEVALPGGKCDATDCSLEQTALRETEEEIGLPQGEVIVVGSLKPFISKHGLQVTPFVGLVPEHAELVASQHELEKIFHVPLNYLLKDPRSDTNQVLRHGIKMNMPVYYYDDHKIWGLTAMILVEFMNRALHAGIK